MSPNCRDPIIEHGCFLRTLAFDINDCFFVGSSSEGGDGPSTLVTVTGCPGAEETHLTLLGAAAECGVVEVSAEAEAEAKGRHCSSGGKGEKGEKCTAG